MSSLTRILHAAVALLSLWLTLFSGLAQAQDYLEPEKAFLFSVKMLNSNTVAVTYTIADGYYMYKERFKFKATGAKLGEAKIPPGKIKFDETFQKEVETYRKKVTIEIPVEASGEFTIISTGQGCADAGLCYPPLDAEAKLIPSKADPKSSAGAGKTETKPDTKQEVKATAQNGKPESPTAPKTNAAGSSTSAASSSASAMASNSPVSASASLPANSASASVAPAGAATVYAVSSPPSLASSSSVPPPLNPTNSVASNGPKDVAAPNADDEAGQIAASFKSGKLIVILPIFFGLGLLLSFTPCVFPMVPILLSIIVGEGAKITRTRSMLLSFAYVLGMTLVYTVLGVAAGLAGEGLAAELQKPAVLGTVGLLMVALSFSMFGFYQIQIPAGIQSKLSAASEKGRGKLFGVFIMGAVSALIVGPCVAPGLAGALGFIMQTRDVILGGSALFALGWGMGVPLLLIGASAGYLLPRAGAWMEKVTRFFGVILLATALWLVAPVFPGGIQVVAWAILLLGYGAYLIWSNDGHWMSKGFGMVFSILGALQLVGAATGGKDPLAPLAHMRSEVVRNGNLSGEEGVGEVASHTKFQRVKSVAELDSILAQTQGRPVMLDFYADWCVSCKEMEKLTFTEKAVKAKLDKMLLLQVDVTENTAEDKALLKRFGLFGPPGIIFFDKQGAEVQGRRVIGYQNSEKFLASLAATQLL
ncbi:MAG: hypothetical protein RL748_1179 [Pseudomonadota bacterium]|jgi:thiol:disulfide interchange protein DsbD